MRIDPNGGLRTESEQQEPKKLESLFLDAINSELNEPLEDFPVYVRRQKLTRLFALYEIFKKIKNIKGSIIECGIHGGFGLFSWAKMSSILEPLNLMRRIYGFDTFEGFTKINVEDSSKYSKHIKSGDLANASFENLNKAKSIYDSTRPLGHVNKINIIKGDACKTIPNFIEDNPHILVSLLFLDFDLYEPTKVAIENFLPRMPKGSIIAFDELDNPLWPGETIAMIELTKSKKLKLERMDFDPYISYAIIE